MNTDRSFCGSSFTVCGVSWILIFLLFPFPALAVEYAHRLGERFEDERFFVPQGPTVVFDALEPMVRKEYVAQELLPEYRWRSWETANYAQKFYRRYIPYEYEGDNFYDMYGRLLTRGWLLYDWRNRQPRQFGNSLWGGGGFGIASILGRGGFGIASDVKGGYHVALHLGPGIYTVLTPMTFSKPAFHGIQMEFSSDRGEATFLLSRASEPQGGGGPRGPVELTDNTHLWAGRMEIPVGDFLRLGATLVNTHESNTLLRFGSFNPLKGVLNTQQNRQSPTIIQIRLSDDSPEDREGGAALFSEEILLTDLEGKVIGGGDIGFHPIVEGGTRGPVFLSADGNETIVLTYDFRDPSYLGPRPSHIRGVSFRLEVAGDYRVEVASDRQTDENGEPVFLTVFRAKGNVRNRSNRRIISFDYGLPTATTIFGCTLEATIGKGFDIQGEVDFSRRVLQYPHPDFKKHHITSIGAHAWYVNASYRAYPGLFFGEMFSMEDGYTTSGFLSHRGAIDYADTETYVYEYVDDNDDLDRTPDWRRFPERYPDPAVFPGWDENNDFVCDFNQNDSPQRPNFVPDYEEPFLRYSVDPPDFLFGMDMNNNGWVDRFENDDLPDYPYKKDHRGYNVYGKVRLGPDVSLTVGQLRERLLSGDGRNLTSYGMFLLDRSYPRMGRVRIFEMVKKVSDSIPDNLFEWVPASAAMGQWQAAYRRWEDPLAARNAWINTSFVGWEYTRRSYFNASSKVKWEGVYQRDPDRVLAMRKGRRRSGFLGMVNKVDYTVSLGPVTLEPRWKSTFLHKTPYLREEQRRRELTQTVYLIARMGFARWHKARVFKSTELSAGVEQTFFNQLQEPTPPGQEGDYRSTVGVVQLTSFSTYIGYRLVTHVGFRIGRRREEAEGVRMGTTGFVTMYAGME